MSRTIWLTAAGAFIVGALIGGGAVETYHRASMAQSKELFNLKIRCSAIGKKYVQESSSYLPGVSMGYSLMQVDYSAARNACVGLIMYQSQATGSSASAAVETVDLNSTGTLSITPCHASTDCNDALTKEHKVFDRVVQTGSHDK